MTPAEIIYQQIGGGMMTVLTGASNFLQEDRPHPALSFRLPQNVSGINYVKIILMPSDTYRVEMGHVYPLKEIAASGASYERTVALDDIYCDQLMDVIEQHTGFFLTLHPRR